MDPISLTQPVSTITGETNVQEAVSDLGSDVFLQLLVTQLQSQDPTNPVENEDFVAQLAQFTTLEQTTNTNKLLEQLVGQQQDNSRFELLNLLGRTVVTEGNTVSVAEADEPILAYALTEEASRVTVEVLGQNGEVLRTLQSAEPEGPGTHQIQWDGTDESGDRVSEGVYQFRINAQDDKQESVPVLSFSRERVANIVLGTDQPIVVESGKTLNAQDIISIQ